jgi:hypothetical protein
MRFFIAFLLALSVFGCAQQPTAEQSYYAAAMAQAERPIFKLEAQPGQQITGLQSITVYNPSSQGVQQYRQQHHPAWSIAATAVQVGLPIYLGGQAAIGLSKAVGDRVGAVARDVVVVDQQSVQVVRPEIVEVPGETQIIQTPTPEVIIVEPLPPLIVPSPDPIIVNQPVLVPGG